MKLINQNRITLVVFFTFLALSNTIVPCMAAEKITCYHADVSGNIVAVTNDSGAVISSYEYSPYGRTLAQDGSSTNSFKFSGTFGITEELPDLYFMRARYYSADAARFLSTDPIKNIGPGWKYAPYEYGDGNPYIHADPSGEIVVSAAILLGFVVVTYIGVPVATMTYFAFNPDKATDENKRKAFEVWTTTTDLSTSVAGTKTTSNPNDYLGNHYSDPDRNSIINHNLNYGSSKNDLVPTSYGENLDSNQSEPEYKLGDTISTRSSSKRRRSSRKRSSGAVKAGGHAEKINPTTVSNAAKSESPKKNTGLSKAWNSAKSTAGNVWKSVTSGTKKAVSKVKSWFKKWF